MISGEDRNKTTSTGEIRMTLSAAKVAQIEDLLTEILIRLPAKPLMKFKCVSKQWLCLISDPQFCASHFLLHQTCDNPKPTALFIDDYYYYHSASKFQVIPLNCSLNFTSVRGDIVVQDCFNVPIAHISQSCNGLLLCRSEYPFEGYGFSHYLCNPTTGQFKRLEVPRNRWHCVCLVYDPKISPHYKIICFHDSWDIPEDDSIYYSSEICIYFSEIDAWNSHRALCSADVGMFVPSSCPQSLYTDFDCQWVYFNGEVHWQKPNRFYTLLCFDVETMTFNKTMQFREGTYFSCFGVSQGHLLGVAEYIQCPRIEYDVVEIAADYSGWFVRYRVNLASILTGRPTGDYPISCIICDKNAEEWIAVISIDDSPMAYNLSDGTHYRLCDPELKLAYDSCKGFQYFENIICI